MKDVIIKVLLIAIGLSAFTLWVATGLWTDSGTVDGRKDSEVTRSVIPQT
ncbi:hypothetical protein M5X11_12965 [Paenibacillus alginolyticus]|nr:hypothetical protein [Paenibacillus alginolyticus]MCY9665866.1 hypothetical protein [Paenibacillus alginolyticus]